VAVLLRAGNNLPCTDWLELQKRAIFDVGKWDIQCEDHSVLAPFPLLLEPATAESLNKTAEELAKEATEAQREMLSRPELLNRLGLPRAIQRLLQKRAPNGNPTQEVRVMRFDFHPTTDGWRISEVNADVPGGFVEASGWNALFARKLPGVVAPPAPSEAYARAILEAAGANALVAFVHATAYSDDRQVMHHLARCFSRQGLRTCLLSPAHLHWKEGRAQIRCAYASGDPDTIVRFFPAEWLPNLWHNNHWQPYFQAGKTVLSNSGTAIVLQTKRFPLIWNQLATNLSTWRRFLPETRDASELNGAPDERWVLKPALGRVGDGIGIHGVTPEAEFVQFKQQARRRPTEWVVQKRFVTLPLHTESGSKYPCIGVFTINGKAAGFYGRIAETPIINQNAQDVAVLVNERPEKETV